MDIYNAIIEYLTDELKHHLPDQPLRPFYFATHWPNLEIGDICSIATHPDGLIVRGIPDVVGAHWEYSIAGQT